MTLFRGLERLVLSAKPRSGRREGQGELGPEPGSPAAGEGRLAGLLAKRLQPGKPQRQVQFQLFTSQNWSP